MAANSAGICVSFKVQLLIAAHSFGTGCPARSANAIDTFKIALFAVSSSITPSTLTYGTTGELANSGTYTAGGTALTNATAPLAYSTTATWNPSATSVQWTSFTSSASFDTALLYNSTQGNTAVAVYALGTQSITSGTLTLTMPTAGAGTSLINIA